MRKFLVGSLVAASVGGGAVITTSLVASGIAGADPTCASGGQVVPTPAGNVTVNPGSGQIPPSSGALQVCSEGSPAINGTATASGAASPGGADGYAVADGNSSNQGAGAGYVGVEGGSTSGGAAVVGCSSGDYATSGTSTAPNDGTKDANGNNVIVNTNGGGSLPGNPSTLATGNCAVTK